MRFTSFLVCQPTRCPPTGRLFQDESGNTIAVTARTVTATPSSGRTCYLLSDIRQRPELPISYDIDKKQRLVVSRLWDVVTNDEVDDHNRALRADPDFDPSYRQLIDLSGITEIRITTPKVTTVAQDQYFTPGTRRAFFAPADVAFGLARMFATRAEAAGQTIGVFRDRKKAEEWLWADRSVTN